MSPRLPGIGVIIRRIPVKVRDVSAAGCLLESADMLPEGAVGQLELTIDGERHLETLQVCRSTRTSGGAFPWRAGARFLSLTAPLPTSVRNFAARFEIMDELGSQSRSQRYDRQSPQP
ncbi:MAG TPA: hypothetical protein VFV95_16085 [Vicinamibacterales bacterium]|nr:hypothetical protein [Vicinamibacterales bacterium]